MKSKPALWITTLVTALTPLIWGSTFVLSTQVLPANYPLTTAAIRTLPAGFALILVTRSFQPNLPWPKMLVLAFLNIAAFQSLLFVAAQRLPGGIAAVASSLQPLIMIFLLWWFERRKPHMAALPAILLGSAGMTGIFLSPDAAFDILGVCAALGGSACIALGTFLSIRWRNGAPLLPFIAWKMALGGLILLGPALLFEKDFPQLTLPQWMGYAYLSLIGTVLAYILWFRGLAILPTVSVSALGLLSPVTAILIGWTLLGETLDSLQLLSIAVVLASVGILQSANHSHQP